MTTLTQAKQQLLTAGFDIQGDGGGGYEIYRDRVRVGRVYSDADLIAWQAPAAITTLVGIAMMDQTEARQVVEQIKGHLDSARKLLLDLEEREGWRALGYATWRACAAAEFGQSQSYLYRQLTAAKIEQAIDSPIGENPESHLRPLTVLDTPAQQKAALGRADELAGDRPRTAKDVQQAVTESRPPALPDVARFGFTVRALPNGWIGLRSAGDGESQHSAAHLAQLIAYWDAYPPIPADLARAGVTWRYRTERGYYQVLIGPSIGPTGYTPDELFATTRDRMQRLPAPAPRPNAPAGWVWGPSGTLRCLADGTVILARLSHQGTIAEAEAHDRIRAELAAARDAQPPDFDAIQARWAALDWHLLSGPTADWYRLLPAPGRADGRTVGIAHMQWHAVVSCLEAQERKAIEAAVTMPDQPLAPRAASSSFSSAEYKNFEEIDDILLDKAANALQRQDFDTADVLLSQIAVKTAARDQLLGQIPDESQDTTRRAQIVALLNQLAPLLIQIQTDDQEGLSRAIADLYECNAGSEAQYALRVCWALLDLEADDA